MVKITDEQRKKMMDTIAGPLGDQAKLLGPVFMNIIENMSDEQVNALIDSAEGLVHAANEELAQKKELKKDNPWFQ